MLGEAAEGDFHERADPATTFATVPTAISAAGSAENRGRRRNRWKRKALQHVLNGKLEGGAIGQGE
jgi:hypothetical protein